MREPIIDLLPEHCMWCPRRCGANRRIGQPGVCMAGDRLRVARAALHFWEEPPISGERGSGAVFFSGCSLHCVYCQNSEISDCTVGKDISLARLTDIFGELEEQGALNINLVTPTHYGPLIVQAISQARERGMGLPIVWNTSGYETTEGIRMLDGVVDVYLTDFKYASPEVAARYSHAPDYPNVACDALEQMLGQSQAKVIVRHLLLPSRLDESLHVLDMLAERFGTDITLSLMSQYTPHAECARYPELSGRTSGEEYERLLDYADALGFDDYFWQEGDAAAESFIPSFDCTGVERAANA